MGHLDNTSVTDRPAATTPPPVDEPRDRGWIALLAIGVAAVTTAVVVIVTSGSDEPSAAERSSTAVRTPAATAPATATLDPALPAPANPTAPVGTPAPGVSAPAAGSSGASGGATTGQPGWEPRTFQGVTFAVPPGATQPDLTDPGNADAPALFNWTGPSLGGEVYSHVSVWVQAASGAPTLGPEYQAITVPGATQARMWTGPTGAEPATTTVDVHVLAGDRFINLVGTFAAGAAGEQAVRDLVASLSIG